MIDKKIRVSITETITRDYEVCAKTKDEAELIVLETDSSKLKKVFEKEYIDIRSEIIGNGE